MLALAFNLATLFPRLYITFFVPAAAKSQGVIDNEFCLNSPNGDVSKRFRVIPLGEEPPEPNNLADNPSTGKKPSFVVVGNLKLEGVSRRRATWAGHIERFLAALPDALKALHNNNGSTSSLSAYSPGGGLMTRANMEATDVVNEELNDGFATRPTLFVLDVRFFLLLPVINNLFCFLLWPISHSLIRSSAIDLMNFIGVATDCKNWNLATYCQICRNGCAIGSGPTIRRFPSYPYTSFLADPSCMEHQVKSFGN